ncbi:T9SS type A sorting domain-containing protein [candidate division KSB1 bacterium]|nr:T9SS type A sorting domain-containing protein [candidate division KSB1 bacterium]
MKNLKQVSYQIQLNAKNLPSGLYFYRISAGSFLQTRKLLVVNKPQFVS